MTDRYVVNLLIPYGILGQALNIPKGFRVTNYFDAEEHTGVLVRVECPGEERFKVGLGSHLRVVEPTVGIVSGKLKWPDLEPEPGSGVLWEPNEGDTVRLPNGIEYVLRKNPLNNILYLHQIIDDDHGKPGCCGVPADPEPGVEDSTIFGLQEGDVVELPGGLRYKVVRFNDKLLHFSALGPAPESKPKYTMEMKKGDIIKLTGGLQYKVMGDSQGKDLYLKQFCDPSVFGVCEGHKVES